MPEGACAAPLRHTITQGRPVCAHIVDAMREEGCIGTVPYVDGTHVPVRTWQGLTNCSARSTRLNGTIFHHQEAAMPIWKPRPASELPRIPLSRWRILEIQDGSRYFVGLNMFDSSGRVSSSIVTFDPVTLQGTTQTGRIYELVGRHGSSLNVEYVWTRWCELYEVTSYVDVTERLLAGTDIGNRA